jgi:hypothetical protein
MLSVRHIQLSGHEDIYLTPRVSFQPEMDNPSQNNAVPTVSKTPTTIWIDCPGGATKALNGGTIFVMNDAGKTIARYDIGASMVPLVDGLGPDEAKRIA